MAEKKTLEQLQETHSEMLATSADIGFEVPEELKADITDLAAGGAIVAALDTAIREFRKGVAGDNEGSDTVAASPSKPKSKKTVTKTKPAADDVPPPIKEKTVTKKAVKKAAVKKAPAKAKPAAAKPAAAKPAKKASAPKGAGAVARASFSDDAKITWLGKDNPAREKSGRHERIELVRKANGKSVKTFRAGKGRGSTLSWCVKQGLAKVA